jgi:tRNA dimethylallyltransferase
MKSKKQKLIVILGQTATGKSDLAVHLAKKYSGEVISADSRQVYKGLDVGSGKITKKEMQGVPHYLLSVANPKEQFSVAEYKALAQKAIEFIYTRKKIPIICGGTGFYIDAVLYDTHLPEVGPNKKLREQLEKKSTEELFKLLVAKDLARAQTIDKHNRPRLIRALEIIEELGKVPKQKKPVSKYNVLKIGLALPDNILKQKIKERLVKRRSKILVEAKKLHTEGLSWKRMEELGLEYRYLARYLQKQITQEEFLEQLEKEIWQYAKRQKTWFKRDKEIVWVNPKEIKKIERQVDKFI